MDHFPVSHSNLSAPALGHFVAGRYGLQNVRCRLIRSGLNDTYAVETDTEKFMFRVYSHGWRTQTEIAEEIRLLGILHTGGVSVSYALPDVHSAFIQTLPAPEGERYGVLFTWAKGEKIHSLPTEAHRRIGELLGRFHLLTQDLELRRVHYTPTVLLVDSLNRVKEFLPHCDERRFMEEKQQVLLHLLKNADSAQLRRGAVHIDVWFDNLNVDAEENITLFDFDFCGNGWLALDLAYHTMQIYHLERDEALCQTKLRAFFDGYESITPLTAEEKRLLPALGVALYFFYLGVQCERFENWSNVFLNSTYLKRYISQIVQRYWDIHAIG